MGNKCSFAGKFHATWLAMKSFSLLIIQSFADFVVFNEFFVTRKAYVAFATVEAGMFRAVMDVPYVKVKILGLFESNFALDAKHAFRNKI